MLLDLVVAKHHIKTLAAGMLPEPHRLTRRILPIVIEIDDVRAPGVAPAGEDGVVLTEVARVLDERDRDASGAHEVAADLGRAIGTAVVDEDDFVSALDLERLDVMDEGGDGRRAVVQRDHEAQGRGHATYHRSSGRPCGRVGHGIEARITTIARVKKRAASL